MTTKEKDVDPRLITDESLCFVCQENVPTCEITTTVPNKGSKKFKLCKDCSLVATYENDLRNRVKASLSRNDTRHIFQYTLGVNLLPIKIEVKEI